MVKLSDNGKNQRKIEIDKEWLKNSFEEGHYIEPIILLHYLIEVIMNQSWDTFCDLIHPLAPSNRMSKKKIKHSHSRKDLYFTSEYKYIIIAEILFDSGIIDSKLYQKLLKFNTARNDSAHRLFKKIPTKTELYKDFKLGFELLETVQKINQELFMKKMASVKRMLLQNTRSK